MRDDSNLIERVLIYKINNKSKLYIVSDSIDYDEGDENGSLLAVGWRKLL